MVAEGAAAAAGEPAAAAAAPGRIASSPLPRKPPEDPAVSQGVVAAESGCIRSHCFLTRFSWVMDKSTRGNIDTSSAWPYPSAAATSAARLLLAPQAPRFVALVRGQTRARGTRLACTLLASCILLRPSLCIGSLCSAPPSSNSCCCGCPPSSSPRGRETRNLRLLFLLADWAAAVSAVPASALNPPAHPALFWCQHRRRRPQKIRVIPAPSSSHESGTGTCWVTS